MQESHHNCRLHALVHMPSQNKRLILFFQRNCGICWYIDQMFNKYLQTISIQQLFSEQILLW